MKKLGFTLAEVLLTLVIIGVVAAMTVPSLMKNTNEEEYRTAAKKAITSAGQALTLHYALENMWAQDYSTAKDLVENVFKKRLNTIEYTGTEGYTVGECDDPETTFATQDGMIFCINNWYVGDTEKQTEACNSYNTRPCTNGNHANLWVDVNGEKGPNRITRSSQQPKDVYQAQIYNQKVVPFGTAAQEVMYNKEVKY